ncbi:hypothetical protein [Robbsia sp. KACC 23696]
MAEDSQEVVQAGGAVLGDGLAVGHRPPYHALAGRFHFDGLDDRR